MPSKTPVPGRSRAQALANERRGTTSPRLHRVTKPGLTRFATLLVAAWLLSPFVFALNPDHKLTQYIHRIWQTQPGLPQTSISAVSQTRDGYIWLGTESGVVRFDGVRFTPIPELEQAGLGDIWARSFTEDSLGRVWILTSDSKLIRVAPHDVKVFGSEQGLPAGKAACVFQDRGGDIWVCTTAGIGRLKGDTWKLERAEFPGPPLAGCQTKDDTIWVAGDAWISSIKGTAVNSKPFGSVPAGSDIYSMVCRDDGIWIGTFRGLLRFTGDNERLYVNADGLVGSIILSLVNGKHGELWIGSQNGVSRYANEHFDNFSYEDGLSQKDVFSLFEDREGSLWVATKHGLNQFLDGPVTPFTRKEGLPSDNVGPSSKTRLVRFGSAL